MNFFDIQKKVYLHDTDATDIVYYSRHLDWFEESRIDFLTKIYKPLTKLIEEDKISFIPISVFIDYKFPAVFEDIITIRLSIKSVETLKLILNYTAFKIVNDKEQIVSKSEITMLCIDITKGGRPTKIPDHLQTVLKEWSN